MIMLRQSQAEVNEAKPCVTQADGVIMQGVVDRNEPKDDSAEIKPRYLKLDEAATYLNVSVPQVYAIVRSGELPAIKDRWARRVACRWPQARALPEQTRGRHQSMGQGSSSEPGPGTSTKRTN